MKAHFEDEQRECVRKVVATDGPALVLREDVARADSCSCSPSPTTTQSQTRSISFYNFYIVIFIIFYLASGFAWLRPPLGTTHSSSNRSRRPFQASFMGSGSACESSGLGYGNRRARARRARSRLGSGLTPAGRHCGTLKETSCRICHICHNCHLGFVPSSWTCL